jgi:hypothetical protein
MEHISAKTNAMTSKSAAPISQAKIAPVPASFAE